MRTKNIIDLLMVTVILFSCGNSTDPDDREDKLYISVRDENGNALEDVGLHFYLDDFGSGDQFPKLNSAGTSDSIVLPLEYSLNQNYPNPFNPQTTIRFSLPKSGHVILHIIARTDSTILKTLLDGNYNAGVYQVLWDGTDDEDNYVTNNVYYYQLITDEFRETKSLLLNMTDPEHIRSLNCIPLILTDANGKLEIDYKIFPVNEKIILTDESGNELGVFNFPDSFTLVLLKENYRSKTIPVKIDPSKPLDLSVELIEN